MQKRHSKNTRLNRSTKVKKARKVRRLARPLKEATLLGSHLSITRLILCEADGWIGPHCTMDHTGTRTQRSMLRFEVYCNRCREQGRPIRTAFFCFCSVPDGKQFKHAKHSPRCDIRDWWALLKTSDDENASAIMATTTSERFRWNGQKNWSAKNKYVGKQAAVCDKRAQFVQENAFDLFSLTLSLCGPMAPRTEFG